MAQKALFVWLKGWTLKRMLAMAERKKSYQSRLPGVDFLLQKPAATSRVDLGNVSVPGLIARLTSVSCQPKGSSSDAVSLVCVQPLLRQGVCLGREPRQQSKWKITRQGMACISLSSGLPRSQLQPQAHPWALAAPERPLPQDLMACFCLVCESGTVCVHPWVP